MTRRKTEPTPIEAFIARLARIAQLNPKIEGLVFWGGAEGWNLSPTESLEPEEIAFYAEGLLIDGFSMDWVLVAEAAAEIGPEIGHQTGPDHLRLCFWQDGEAPPALLAGWLSVESGRWTAVGPA